MTAQEPERGWGGRIARASIVLVGFMILGPLVPGLAFAAAAAIGGHLASGQIEPALSFPTLASNALTFAFFGGGGLAATLCGALLAAVMLSRGRLRLATVTRTAAFTTAVVSVWTVRTAPLAGAVFLTLGFTLIAVFTARALYRLAEALRVLP